MASPADLAALAKPGANIERAREEGRQEGRREAREEILSFLQKEYMRPEVERGTPEATAILKVAQRVSEHFSTPAGSKRRGRR